MATTNATHPKITIDLVRSSIYPFLASQLIHSSSQVLDRLTTKDVLRGILHSILFHRLFGTVKPQTFEVLDVTMVCTPRLLSPHEHNASLPKPGVSDPGMEQLVNTKVNAFWNAIEGGANKRGQVSHSWHGYSSGPLTPRGAQIKVTFSEKRPKKSWFQVYAAEEDVPWEQWSVANTSIYQSASHFHFSLE